MYYTNKMQITKEEKPKLNKKMKLLDRQQKYMLKKEQVTQDTQVEKHLYLLEVELLTVQKDSQIIKQENLTRVKKN